MDSNVDSVIKIKVVEDGVTTTTTKINGLASSIRHVKKEGDKTTTIINKFGKETEAAGKKTKGLGNQLFGAGLALMAIHKAMAFVSDEVKRSIKEFREFETSIAEINTILREQEEDILPSLADSIENMSMKYGKSVADLSKGLYDILSAAFAAKNSIYLLDIATKASIAGLTDVRVAVDTFTTILNSYGYSVYRAAEVSDILFQSVVRGKFQFEDLEAALGYVVPIASQAGIGLDELSAALSTTTRHGLHLDMTSRGLALMIQGFINPTKKAADAADEYGIRMDSVYLKSRGLVGMMQQLSDATKEYGTSILPNLIGNMRSLRVAMVLASEEGFTGMIEDMKLLNDISGRTNEAAEEIMETQAYQAEQMEQKRQNVERTFGGGLGEISIALQGGILMLAGVGHAIVDLEAGFKDLDNLFGKTNTTVETGEKVYGIWAGMIEKGNDTITEQRDIIRDLNNAIEDYHDELDVGTGYYNAEGKEIEGTLYLQLARLEADKKLSDMQHEVNQGLLQEGYNYKSLSIEGQKAIKFLREYKDQEEKNSQAMKRYTLAMQQNNLEVMKLQLRGMMRRRGLSRAEERRMKQLRIESLQEKINVQETNKAVSVSDYDRYLEAQKTIDLEVNAAKERVYEINYTYDLEIETLQNTIDKRKEMLADDLDNLNVHMSEIIRVTRETSNILNDIMRNSYLSSLFQAAGVDVAQMGREFKFGANPYNAFSKGQRLARRFGMIKEEFQSGTYRVPNTGPAIVHEGEQIIPKGGRGRGMGGNIHVDPMHINVNVYDHTGVEQLVQKIELAIQGGLVSGISTGYS